MSRWSRRVGLAAAARLPMRTGALYVPRGGSAGRGMQANRLYAYPWIVPNAVACQALRLNLTAAAGQNTKIRLGLAADDGTGRPDVLTQQTSEMAIASGASGNQSPAWSALALQPGIWWVFAYADAPLTVWGWSGSGATISVIDQLGSSGGPNGNVAMGWTLPRSFDANGIPGGTLAWALNDFQFDLPLPGIVT